MIFLCHSDALERAVAMQARLFPLDARTKSQLAIDDDAACDAAMPSESRYVCVCVCKCVCVCSLRECCLLVSGLCLLWNGRM